MSASSYFTILFCILFTPIQALKYYSLQTIILFDNIDVSKHILEIDIFVFVKSNMDLIHSMHVRVQS
jgi:hypothetical protein